MSFPILSIIILAPIIGAILIMVLPKEEHKLIKIVAALSSFVSLILSVYIYVAYDAAQGGFQYLEEILWLEQFGISYSLGVDGLSIPMMLLTGLVIFTAIFASWTVDTRVKEFFAFLLVMVAGIFGVFAARDLFWFFIFYELVVIPTYVIIIVWGSTRKEYGAMKLTLYHAISSAFILISIISTYIYASNQLGFGTFDIQTLATVQYDPFFQKTIFLLMLIGFGILVPMWPMHTWAPDGHVASPAAVSMLLAGVVMKMGGYGLIRAALFFFPEGAIFWAPLIAVFCIINVLYGALIAMVQKDLKYVIGYSS
ncbi:MAG: NADH-quinone oxidoreductase subunit M, partial [Clostridia bacterium]|nr:NADH-quinone oxidoreductase subunit M [Clostridia bacterium]